MVDSWFPSKWGVNDEVGALNEISCQKILDAIGLIKKGEVYDLSHTLEMGIPNHWFHGPFLYSTFRRHVESLSSVGGKTRSGGMNIRIEMPDQVGTHLDGINHISIGDLLYNGHQADSITGAYGTSRLGMEKTPPIFTRGVLADIASFKKQKILPPNHVISREELCSCFETCDITVTKGDVLLIATGWGSYWMSNNERYLGPCPGIGLSAAQWIADQGVVIVGADTWEVEIDPAEDPETSDVVHQLMITKNGIRLIENMNLEKIRQDGVVEFLFVCLPLRIKGGTGSPITPVAVI